MLFPITQEFDVHGFSRAHIGIQPDFTGYINTFPIHSGNKIPRLHPCFLCRITVNQTVQHRTVAARVADYNHGQDISQDEVEKGSCKHSGNSCPDTGIGESALRRSPFVSIKPVFTFKHTRAADRKKAQ